MGGAVSNVTRGIVDAATLGTAEIGGISKKIGGGFSNSAMKAPVVGGNMSPMQMLTTTGGAPLLMNIALGANVDDTLQSFLGLDKSTYNWIKSGATSGPGVSPEDGQAIQALRRQLVDIADNTELKNQAVQKLANDFPNMMAAKIPQYSAIADEATKQVMQQAMDTISAKQAAGGMFSSGATAEAAAKAGAGIAMDKLNYGTGLALQDFATQYSQASALQNFQQKMLGQGATQGFNAVQNALAGNRSTQQQQANLNFQADQANQNSQNAMWGSLGQLGGTAIGGMFGGPAGAAVGGSIEGNLAGNANRLTSFVPMPPPSNSQQYAPMGVNPYGGY